MFLIVVDLVARNMQFPQSYSEHLRFPTLVRMQQRRISEGRVVRIQFDPKMLKVDLGGGFKKQICLPLPGEMIQFD